MKTRAGNGTRTRDILLGKNHLMVRGLTKAQIEAIEYIGSHRKTGTRVGKHIHTRTFYSLKKRGLVMWVSLDKKTCMLTYWGERIWTKMHPHSKYRIS